MQLWRPGSVQQPGQNPTLNPTALLPPTAGLRVFTPSPPSTSTLTSSATLDPSLSSKESQIIWTSHLNFHLMSAQAPAQPSIYVPFLFRFFRRASEPVSSSGIRMYCPAVLSTKVATVATLNPLAMSEAEPSQARPNRTKMSLCPCLLRNLLTIDKIVIDHCEINCYCGVSYSRHSSKKMG